MREYVPAIMEELHTIADRSDLVLSPRALFEYQIRPDIDACATRWQLEKPWITRTMHRTVRWWHLFPAMRAQRLWHPDRIRSEAAFAKLCGACPIPASSGMTTGRHRLNRGGHRQANAALYRAVIVRMRYHQPTVDDVARRTADGRTKREIIRCLKRFLAREIYQRVMTDFRARQEIIQAA